MFVMHEGDQLWQRAKALLASHDKHVSHKLGDDIRAKLCLTLENNGSATVACSISRAASPYAFA
jgi:hypothetical protein